MRNLAHELDVGYEIINFKNGHLDCSAYIKRLWRGVYSQLRGRDVREAATLFNLDVEDLLYIQDQLSPADLDVLRKKLPSTCELPADLDLVALMKDLKPWCWLMVRRNLGFVLKNDDSLSPEDLINDLLVEAIRSVTTYLHGKDEHDVGKIKNFAIETVKNHSRKMVDHFAAQKRARVTRTSSVHEKKKNNLLPIPETVHIHPSPFGEKWAVVGPCAYTSVKLTHPIYFVRRESGMLVRGTPGDLRVIQGAMDVALHGIFLKARYQDEFQKVVVGDYKISKEDEDAPFFSEVISDSHEAPWHSRCFSGQDLALQEDLKKQVLKLFGNDYNAHEFCRLLFSGGSDPAFIAWCEEQGVDMESCNEKLFISMCRRYADFSLDQIQDKLPALKAILY